MESRRSSQSGVPRHITAYHKLPVQVVVPERAIGVTLLIRSIGLRREVWGSDSARPTDAPLQ